MQGLGQREGGARAAGSGGGGLFLLLGLNQPLVVLDDLVGDGLVLDQPRLDLVVLLRQLLNELDAGAHRFLVCMVECVSRTLSTYPTFEGTRTRYAAVAEGLVQRHESILDSPILR